MLTELASQPSFKGGYRMIEALFIQNFRCYSEVRLNDLKSVNIVVGRNASGKTAFLEALYFPLGSPALAFKLNIWRGLGQQVHFTESSETRSGVWRDLFYNFEQNRTVKVGLKGTSDINRSVRITCRSQESQFVSSGKSKSIISEIPPITFEYFQGEKLIATVKPNFTGEGIVVDGTPEPLSGTFFPSTLQIDPQETARHFSSLSKKGKLKPVLEALQELYPMIEDLSLELHNTLPIVHASVKGVSERMPLGLVSSGVSKMLAYLVSIADKHGVGGVVIIDEIENGFYYNRMGEVWTVLHKFCLSNNVQLFASTHSAECLKALESVLAESSSDFSLIRTIREDDQCKLRHFQGNQFLAALEENIEIR